MGHAGARSAWSSRDFLLTQKFCELSEIQAELDRLRRSSKAPILGLIAFDSRDWLKALSFFSAPPALANIARAAATAADWIAPARTKRQDARATANFVDKLLPSEGLRNLRAIRSTFPDRTGPAASSIGIWLVGDSLRVANLPQRNVDRLGEMVNGTLVAASHRAGRISDLVRQPPASEAALEPQVNELLRVAVEYTSASAALFYIRNLHERNLGEVGKHIAEPMWDRAVPREIPLEGGAALSEQCPDQAALLAFRRSRQFSASVRRAEPQPVKHVLRGPVTAGASGAVPARTLTQDVEIRAAAPRLASAFWTCNAFPVPTVSLGSSDHNLGVLVVWKRGTKPGVAALTGGEVSAFEEVALRISHLESLAANRVAARHLLAFSEGLTGPLASASSELDKIPNTNREEVPSDVRGVRDELANLAEHARNATRSDSVTIRALVAANESNPPVLLLRRFVASPATRLDLPSADLPAAELGGTRRNPYVQRSANVYAALRGSVSKPTYVRDTSTRISRQVAGLLDVVSVTANTLSEVAVPIIAGGLVVGTMNFESSSKRHFDDHLDTISSFAALAGIAVSLRRREVVRAVAERLSFLQIGHHDMLAFKDILNRLEPELRPRELDALRTAAARLESPIVKTLPRQWQGQSRIPVSEVLKRAYRDAGSPLRSELLVPDGLACSAKIATVLLAVASELFANAVNSGDAAPAIEARHLIVRDVPYVSITMSSRSRTTDKRPLHIQQLYHGAIPATDGTERPHLGCLTVGELVRGVSGNVFASLLSPDVFRTHILIPEK